MTARVSMLLKRRASLTCFRACFFRGRAKDLSAPRYYVCVYVCIYIYIIHFKNAFDEYSRGEKQTYAQENNNPHLLKMQDSKLPLHASHVALPT